MTVMEIKIGSLIELKEAGDGRFMVTKVVTSGFGIVYFLKSFSGFLPNCVMKTFKEDVYNEDIFREALLWSRLGYHRNIAEYICIGEYQNHFYILSPRYESTLEKFIEDINTTCNIRGILVDIIAGLNYVYHRFGLVHRDIKPANIFMDNGIAKIGDFGLTTCLKVSNKQALKDMNLDTVFEQSKQDYGGTIPFMAPEVLFRYGEFSVSTDIYALGVTIFSLLTQGELPYSLPRFEINHRAFNKLKSIADDRIAKVVMKCINLNPNVRYCDYSKLLEDLGEAPSPYCEKAEIESIINYIQTLRRTEQTFRANAVIEDMLKQYPGHPLIINQQALICLLAEDYKTFIRILEELDLRNRKYPDEYYLDPMCNLAGYYFEVIDLSQVYRVMKSISTIMQNSPERLPLYPEYGIFLYLEGKYEEAFSVFQNILKMRNMKPKAVLLYAYLGVQIGRSNDVLSLISSRKEGSFAEIAEFCENNPKKLTLLANQFRSEILEAKT